MREKIVLKILQFIKSNNENYTEEQLEIIQYGLESIYILFTKTVVIFSLAYLFGILKEVIIFTLLYNLIRMTSFGLHATKSWMCFLSSAMIFLLIPYICAHQAFPFLWKLLIGCICILLIFKNAPADTVKRPIIDPIRRRNYKIISTIIATSLVLVSLFSSNMFLSNSCIFSLIVQCFMISPAIYKFFHLPYNNYKSYMEQQQV